MYIIDRLRPMPRTLFRKDGFSLKEGRCGAYPVGSNCFYLYINWLEIETYMTLSKQTSRRGHGFASLFPSKDKKSFPLGRKCEAFGPYDSLILY